MSDGDWLVALGGLLTGVGAIVTIIIDCRQGDLTELQEKILRKEKERWKKGGEKGSEPDDAAAGNAAKTVARRWRLIPLGVLAVAAVVAILAGLIVG